MKKLFLAAVMAVFTLSNVNAQEVKFGAKAGVNFASLKYKSKSAGVEVKPDGLTSFHVGAVAELGLSDKFAIQPELVYSVQGATTKVLNKEVKTQLSYLNLPIMAKYFVAEGISVELGPQIGFLMSAKNKSGSDSQDFKDSVKGIDFGLGFGAGYRLENGLNFGARYNIGMSDISDSEDMTDVSIKNNVIQISVGYFFN